LAQWVLEIMKQNVTGKDNNMIDQFDEILLKHLKRLIGSKYGIDKLVLNCMTISLITLLMERENEIETFASDEIDRYTRETLIEDFKDIGFSADQDMNVIIENMIQKGYMLVDGDRLIPQKPATSMARLMDMVFPKMPGMNLVAYFVQTMNEVRSNRKDIDSATTQFDQILQMQGIPLEKESLDKEIKTPEILGRKSSDSVFNHSKNSSNEPKVLSPDAYKGKIQITKLNFGESGLNKAEPDIIPTGMMTTSEAPAKTVSDDPIQRFDASAAETPAHDSILSVEEISQDRKPTGPDKKNLYDGKDDFSKIASTPKEPETGKEAVEDHSEIRNKKEIFPISDDDIEKRISAFEEDLALECPICRQSKLRVKSTATGKSYYKCSNKECSFISWGKPHHILCPKCNNPFLIETSNKAGTTSLKCPRATCRYHEKIRPDRVMNRMERVDSATQETDTSASMAQKPRRRVVRRRVVRRKR
jgi:ssDNA-binding Zn-finger/Zn-ribbon topoisomerase 1